MTPKIAKQTITQTEEINLNTWPAARVLHQDGWVMGFSGGYTRRANTVWPLYASRLPLQEKVVNSEGLYESFGMPCTFKMSDAAQPDGLDDFLKERGYIATATTSVQTRDIVGPTLGADGQVELVSAFDEGWLTAYALVADLGERARRGLEALLGRLSLPAAYALVRHNGSPCAFALAVLQQPYLTFYNVLVHSETRRRGYATALMESLMRWGGESGARTAMLHVMTNNPPALGLYRGLGFGEIYQYWYRSQPAPQQSGRDH